MSKKQRFFCVKGDGTNKLYFRDLESALELFKLLSKGNVVEIDSELIDKVRKADSDGYVPSDWFYYIKKENPEIHLEAVTKDIYTLKEIKKIKKEREAKKKELKKEKK